MDSPLTGQKGISQMSDWNKCAEMWTVKIILMNSQIEMMHMPLRTQGQVSLL